MKVRCKNYRKCTGTKGECSHEGWHDYDISDPTDGCNTFCRQIGRKCQCLPKAEGNLQWAIEKAIMPLWS